MNFFNFLSFICFFVFNAECSRSLVKSLKRTRNLSSLIPSKELSTAVPKSQPSWKRLIKWSAIGVGGGIVTLGLTSSIFDVDELKRPAPDLPDENGRTPIFNAVLNGDKSTFFAQIHERANLNVRDNFGVTLMELVIKKGSVMHFSVLLVSDVDMKQLDSHARPYLYTAISNQRFHFARQIIKVAKIFYKKELIREMMYLACLALPKEGVDERDRFTQIPLIIDLYLLSSCDREMLIKVMQSIHPDQMDQSVKIAIKLIVNNFVVSFLCPFIPIGEKYSDFFDMKSLAKF